MGSGVIRKFSITYSLAQVPSGLMGDMLGAHLFLGSIIILWSLALAMHALAPNVTWMTGARVCFGLTQAGCYPTLSQISRVWFRRSIRTTLQGWVASFFGRSGGNKPKRRTQAPVSGRAPNDHEDSKPPE